MENIKIGACKIGVEREKFDALKKCLIKATKLNPKKDTIENELIELIGCYNIVPQINSLGLYGLKPLSICRSIDVISLSEAIAPLMEDYNKITYWDTTIKDKFGAITGVYGIFFYNKKAYSFRDRKALFDVYLEYEDLKKKYDERLEQYKSLRNNFEIYVNKARENEKSLKAEIERLKAENAALKQTLNKSITVDELRAAFRNTLHRVNKNKFTFERNGNELVLKQAVPDDVLERYIVWLQSKGLKHEDIIKEELDYKITENLVKYLYKEKIWK